MENKIIVRLDSWMEAPLEVWRLKAHRKVYMFIFFLFIFLKKRQVLNIMLPILSFTSINKKGYIFVPGSSHQKQY